jgi:hypothetical protein
VLDGLAEARGDGLLLHEKQLRLKSLVCVVVGLVGVLERRIRIDCCDRFEKDGFWRFNHEECWDDLAEGVGDLESRG